MLHTFTAFTALTKATTMGVDAPTNAIEAFSALEGTWHGELEYRDYQSDTLQTIPPRVEFDAIPDDTTFIQRSTFADVRFPVRITTLVGVETTLVGVEGEAVRVANSRAGRPFESYAQTAPPYSWSRG